MSFTGSIVSDGFIDGNNDGHMYDVYLKNINFSTNAAYMLD
jgi:hypothetical protein